MASPNTRRVNPVHVCLVATGVARKHRLWRVGFDTPRVCGVCQDKSRLVYRPIGTFFCSGLARALLVIGRRS